MKKAGIRSKRKDNQREKDKEEIVSKNRQVPAPSSDTWVLSNRSYRTNSWEAMSFIPIAAEHLLGVTRSAGTRDTPSFRAGLPDQRIKV